MKIKIISGTVFFGVIFCVFLNFELDLGLNYRLTPATVSKVSRGECRLHFEGKFDNYTSLMACSKAEALLASNWQYQNAEVEENVEVTYAYTSPVDGKLYTDNATQAVIAGRRPRIPSEGDTVSVYASKNAAGRSKFFI